MESELQALIHMMMTHHATDAHFIFRDSRLTLRFRCPKEMVDDESGMFDGRLLHYLKYIAHLDLGVMSAPQSGSDSSAADRRIASAEPKGTDQDRGNLPGSRQMPAFPCAVPAAARACLAQRSHREREIDDTARADA